MNAPPGSRTRDCATSALRIHQDSALHPLIAQLNHAAGIRRTDTDGERLAKLEDVIAEATDRIAETAPLLADLLGIPAGDRYPPLDLTPAARKAKTLEAPLRLVEGLAARRPVLMIFEDAHWSDPTTRALLDILVDRLAVLRVLLVITFRPEFVPAWRDRAHFDLLGLGRLAPDQCVAIISHLTGGRVLPGEIDGQILDRTDGVPLFVEELTKTVLEGGLVRKAGNAYIATALIGRTAIPETLLARLDRMAETRDLAQLGAALGRQFSYGLIAAVAELPPVLLERSLERLESAELIFRRDAPPDAEYTFKHALVQDAAYGTMLRVRRQRLHGRIAAVLETDFPEVSRRQPETLARHCAEGGTDREDGGALHRGLWPCHRGEQQRRGGGAPQKRARTRLDASAARATDRGAQEPHHGWRMVVVPLNPMNRMEKASTEENGHDRKL